MIITEEKKRLFETVKSLLGAPVVKVELTEDQLCTLFNTAVSDYSEITQNWLIKTKWINLYSKNLTNVDLTFAMSTQSLDYEKEFTYAYSKQVGLQQRGPYELKKDFIILESGKQVYEIPAGREINKVLWATPPPLHQALTASYGGYNAEFGGSFSQIGTSNLYGSGGIGSVGGYYVSPAYDILATTMDLSLKQKILKSDLIYKVTAGPNGTKLLHLMNTPGRTNFTGFSIGGGFDIQGCSIWYHYYETANSIECQNLNPDIIITPDQVPLEDMDYNRFNLPTKNFIRRLMVADSKRLLAMIRGRFSGQLKIADAEMVMDYKQLEAMGDKERDEAKKELIERLEEMSPQAMIKRAAEQSKDLRDSLKGTPLGLYTC